MFLNDLGFAKEHDQTWLAVHDPSNKIVALCFNDKKKCNFLSDLYGNTGVYRPK